MVDAVSHMTGQGAATAAGTTGQSAHMVGRDQLPQEGMPQADAQAGMPPGANLPYWVNVSAELTKTYTFPLYLLHRCKKCVSPC